jgi:PAS domain S-box-containing protein
MNSRNPASAAVSPSAAFSPDQPLRGLHAPVLLAILIFALSLLATFVLWNSAQTSARQKLRDDFDFRVREIADRIQQRMAAYEEVLRGTKGFLLGSSHVDHDAFHFYVEALRLEQHFPGIQAVAYSKIVPKQELEAHVEAVRSQGFPDYAISPAGERDLYTSIILIEPFDTMNRRAFGYDMFSEPVRRAAMAKARDSGEAALSGKVTLVQEGSTDVQAGFLMYLPMYRRGAPADTLERRQANILGWVYAPFRMNDFMSGLGGERSSELAFAVYDGTVESPQTCLFGCDDAAAHRPLLATATPLEIAGHRWMLDVRSTPAFEARGNSGKPTLIAIAGIGAALLLAALVWVLASGRRRALALAIDMTHELRESHQQIETEQRRMRVILENSHDAFIALDREGLVTDWNAEAERTFGWRAAEAVGKDVADLIIPPDQREAHREGFRRFTASGKGLLIGRRVEMTALYRDGTLFPIELAIAGIRDEDGYVANAFIRDLTEHKATERREAQRQQALDQARAALQHTQKLEAVGKLTGGVAHDFNNVLQIIAGNIQLLLHIGDQKEQREKRLNSVLEAVERGSKLSAQLLAFARRQPLQPKVANIRRLLGNMDDLLRRALGESIEIETIVGGGLWNTLIDPHQLENVILNLAINARDAMEGDGKLTIEIGNAMLDDEYVLSQPDIPAGQYVVLAVSDTGSGMPPEVLEHAFEPFFTTKPAGEGTGLGLSMAYGFVRQSGGHIRIYSEVGHGTTVRIYLPRAFEPEEEFTPVDDGPVTGGNETILVVEDDPAVQSAVVATLEELGYRVLHADDGESALAVIQRGEKIDLLFTDVVMPGAVRSPELAKRAKQILPDLAVLFTSGYTQNAIVHGGRLDPGVQLLSKPYRREQLARKIRQVLARREAE